MDSDNTAALQLRCDNARLYPLSSTHIVKSTPIQAVHGLLVQMKQFAVSHIYPRTAASFPPMRLTTTPPARNLLSDQHEHG